MDKKIMLAVEMEELYKYLDPVYATFGWIIQSESEAEAEIARIKREAQLEILDKVLGEVSIIHDKGYVRTCDIEKLREELK